MPEKSTHAPEHYKMLSDYLKHLTTLSTGSLLLLVTFLEKIFVQPLWKPLVIIALVSFLLSVIASIASFTLVISLSANYKDQTEPQGWEETVNVVSIIVTWLGFLIGVASLTVFAIRNLVYY